MGKALRNTRVLGWVMVVLGCLVIATTVVLVVWTHLGQRADQRSLWSVTVPWTTKRVLAGWLDLISVEFIAVVLAVMVLLALMRRRVSRALAALAVVAGSNLATQVLKAGLPRPDMGIGSENTLPSGHVTVVTSLVLATLFVVPARWRRIVVLLATGAGTLTGAATLIQRWHRPSDVIAAYAVCGVFAGLGLIMAERAARVDGASTGSWRIPKPVGHVVAALIGAALAGAFLLVAGLVTHGEASNVIVGGIVLTAMGLTCATVVALTAIGLDAAPQTNTAAHVGGAGSPATA